MLFISSLIFVFLFSESWSLLNCHKCRTNIFFNQSIQIPTSCDQLPADFCTLDIHIDFELETINLTFSSARKKDLGKKAIFDKSITYANYFDFQKPHFGIFLGIYCSTNDTCIIDDSQQQVRNILNEMPSSVWKDLRLKLMDILILPSDPVSSLKCYTPNNTEVICSSEISRCYLDHKWHPNAVNQFEKDDSEWLADCGDNTYKDMVLRLGYEKYEPSLPESPDMDFISLNCNKPLCNGGKAVKQMSELIAQYPAIGGWMQVRSAGLVTVLCPSFHFLYWFYYLIILFEL